VGDELTLPNSLTMGARKRRIDPDFRRATLSDLALLDITTDQQTDSDAWTETLKLADFRLTIYDAVAGVCPALQLGSVYRFSALIKRIAIPPSR
jgi:hypothetical protein